MHGKLQRQKPRLFIGSSLEAIEVANEIHVILDHDACITPWDSLFSISDISLQRLCKSLDAFDFGIFVFSPDDIGRIRKRTYTQVRDNVLFELGLFIGKLGQKRNFIVMPRGLPNFRLPTDLLGITSATYEAHRPDKDLKSALKPACQEIRRALRRLGPIRRKSRASFTKVQKQLASLLGEGVLILKTSRPKTRVPKNQAVLRPSRRIKV
jgi:predicted nucleotide-binding protein